ncbi:MAG TPA: hypothetical protein VEV42_09690 [Pyrinomonadaceae bacterium]|nr:hypothetical protein [Pyrinomonadaceae bacterium]
MSRTAFIILLVCCCGPGAQPQGKGASKPPCPDERAWTGRYRNYVFGFSIRIPRGLKGYWNSPRCAPDEKYGCVCMNDHGRFIPLASEAHIEAFVGYQMEPDWSVREHERQAVSFLRDDKQNQHVTVVHSLWFRLGSLRARRFEARYLKNNKPVITDHIVALYKGVEYELILVTSRGRYAADRRQFEKFIATWRLTPRL